MSAATKLKRLLIADASNLIFRGSAIKLKTDPEYKGGWSFLCRKIFDKIQETHPTHLVVACDGYQSSQKRRELWKDYKLNRPSCPEIIKYQLANVGKLCDILNIGYVSQESYEADDIINTFVQQAIKRNFDSIDIIGDDKDLLTLLQFKNVQIHKLSKSRINPIYIENASFDVLPINNMNVRASQICDFLALVGDTVDNIPGCPTIGVKRAQLLLNQFNDIDTIYNNLNHIALKHKSMANHLQQNEETVRRGLELIKLYDLTHILSKNIDNMTFDINSVSVENQQTKDGLIQLGLETLYKQICKVKKEYSGNFDIVESKSM